MGTLEEKWKEKYDIGYPILEKIWEMDKTTLGEFLESLLVNFNFADNFKEFSNTKITKTIEDDKFSTIKISYYDTIIIDFCGIHYKGEHGQSSTLRLFDRYFKLD